MACSVGHQRREYEEWGASGSIRIAPGTSGRGVSLTVAPSWGTAASGVDRLWSIQDARRLTPNGDRKPGGRLEAEIGYGVGVSGGRGVLTPYSGLSLSNDGERTYRLGGRWKHRPGAQHEPGGRSPGERRRGLARALADAAGLHALVRTLAGSARRATGCKVVMTREARSSCRLRQTGRLTAVTGLQLVRRVCSDPNAQNRAWAGLHRSTSPPDVLLSASPHTQGVSASQRIACHQANRVTARAWPAITRAFRTRTSSKQCAIGEAGTIWQSAGPAVQRPQPDV